MYLPVCLARASKLTSLLSYCVTLLGEGEITTCSSNKRRSSSPSTTIIIKREEITIQANERSPEHGKVPEKCPLLCLCPERQENKRIREKQIQSESETVSNSNDNQVSFELENFNEVWNWKSNSHRPQTKRRDIALMTLCNKKPF